jgi:hypothetical protein
VDSSSGWRPIGTPNAHSERTTETTFAGADIATPGRLGYI